MYDVFTVVKSNKSTLSSIYELLFNMENTIREPLKDMENTIRNEFIKSYLDYKKSIDEKNADIKIAHFDNGKGTKPNLLESSFEEFMKWMEYQRGREEKI